ADHGGHGGHPVGFPLEQSFDSSEDFCVHIGRAMNGVFEGLNTAHETFVRRFPSGNENQFTM
ncbi:MAG: hypothetical protein ACPGDD_04210, partial [Poseidonia sp.]